MTVVPIESKYLDLKREGEGLTLRFVPGTDLTVGSHRRVNQSLRLVKTELRRFANQVKKRGGCIKAHFPNADLETVSALASRIDAKLDRLRNEKITIKMVEEILRLTPLERQRWTKDGRLPAAGNAFIERGQKIRLWTYSPDVIARLWSNPEIIEDWRRADQAKANCEDLSN